MHSPSNTRPRGLMRTALAGAAMASVLAAAGCGRASATAGTVFGLIARPRGHVLDLGQLVTHAQQAQPQRVPNLVDQLHVRRDTGPAVQVELDHRDLAASAIAAGPVGTPVGRPVWCLPRSLATVELAG